MRTYSGDIDKIRSNMLPVLNKWLTSNSLSFEKIEIGKPWPGPYGFYVDDRSISPSELILRSHSLEYFEHVSVIISFFNESQNIKRLWYQLQELSKILDVSEFIFVDNGSTDDTLPLLQELALSNCLIKVLSNQYPSSYSNGYNTALANATGQSVLMLHADCQINIDASYKLWVESMLAIKNDGSSSPKRNNNIVFSIRQNRQTITEYLFTFVNNCIASAFLFKGSYIDFNSQPKIFPRSICGTGINAPGYLFDLQLSLKLFLSSLSSGYTICPSINSISMPRMHGQSSWNSSLMKRFCISLSYLKFYILNFNI